MKKSPDQEANQPQEQEPAKEAPEAAAQGQAGEDSAEAWKQKAENYWDQLLRLQADFANFRKRSEKEKAEAIRFGREVMIEKMIFLLDILESAVRHAQGAADLDSLKKGFEMAAQEFARALKSEGAEPLKTVGEKFDPHLHEAVEQVPTDQEEQNNRILEELQRGYLFNGRLLRPARVKVAKKAAPEAKPDPQGEKKD